MSNRKKKTRKSSFVIGMGVLLTAAALFLTGYNLWMDQRAGANSDRILGALETQISEAAEDRGEEQPLYKMYPDMEMPSFRIDGGTYIGVLEIPALGIELPVLESWSYAGLNLAPCRYSGSAYCGDMIIAGHNFRQHFGNLQNLKVGDEISFTDADGNVFWYQTAAMEMIPGTDVTDMENGEWDMTLFTCNYSGKSRFTVRCVEKNQM